jgi:transcriptional regulator with XRE-family HTH domain
VARRTALAERNRVGLRDGLTSLARAGRRRVGAKLTILMSRSSLGDIIRRQRELQQLSVRQFAQMAGISNPYLSQIERGLREPSERVVDAIARSLEVSADALYEQAGMNVSDEDTPSSAVRAAIEADPALTGRQRRALLEVYEAFTAVGPQRRSRRG